MWVQTICNGYQQTTLACKESLAKGWHSFVSIFIASMFLTFQILLSTIFESRYKSIHIRPRKRNVTHAHKLIVPYAKPSPITQTWSILLILIHTQAWPIPLLCIHALMHVNFRLPWLRRLLSMGMVVIRPFILVSKPMKTKTRSLHYTGYLNSIKTYKAMFIANSSSCTTTELSKLLTSCLTAIKKHVVKNCEKDYETSGKNLFWYIKKSGEVLDKLKARDFNATSLSTYDFSSLYTTLPHNSIKDKRSDLI